MSTENAKTLAVYDEYAEKFLQGCVARAAGRSPEENAAKRKWEESFLTHGFDALGQGAEILEIGSGDCQNACFLREQGFSVTASDVAPGFLKQQVNCDFIPMKFNLLTDAAPVPANMAKTTDDEATECTTMAEDTATAEGGKPENDPNVKTPQYNGILAWHVLLHFTADDLRQGLAKIYQMLTPGGRLVCDIQNLDDKTDEYAIDGASARWTDYGGAYHLGADRFFQYWSEGDFRTELEKAGFKIINFAKTGGTSGQRWLCFAAEKPAEN